MTVKLQTKNHLEFLSLKGAAQACLSLHLSKCHIVGNHMSWLIYFHDVMIPTQCIYRFFASLIGPLTKLNCFYTSIKTHTYEYLLLLISALIVLIITNCT